MIERWTTPEEVALARERYEAALGWERPAAFRVGYRVTRDVSSPEVDEPLCEEIPGEAAFARVEAGSGYLFAAILATVLGHRGGSVSYRLGRDDLERAVDC